MKTKVSKLLAIINNFGNRIKPFYNQYNRVGKQIVKFISFFFGSDGLDFILSIDFSSLNYFLN